MYCCYKLSEWSVLIKYLRASSSALGKVFFINLKVSLHNENVETR